MKKTHIVFAFVLSLCLVPTFAQGPMKPQTPPELVATYEALADTILSVDEAEEQLVASILATTYAHARAAKAEAVEKIEAGESARAELERLAAYVSQLGNEGDSAVAGVRKRLVEGGHHHNAMGEQKGIYDEGFVIVTRAAKKVLLDAATEIGKMARSATVQKLETQWDRVEKEYRDLMEAHSG